MPSLETALAYEAIFRVPVRELFAGLYQEIEQDVRARAKILGYKVERQTPNRKTVLKLKAIAAMVGGDSEVPVKP